MRVIHHCPICEGTSLTLLHPLWENRNSLEHFKIHKDRYFGACDSCGTIFRFPLFILDDVCEYGKEYYESPGIDAYKYIEYHTAMFQKHNYEHVVELLHKDFPVQDYHKWLDVGSVGYPTSFEDYEFHTLEPSWKAVETGKKLFNSERIFQGSISTFKPSRIYDGILFNNSIYCLPDPRISIKRCREFLKDSGIIIVTLGAYLNGAKNNSFDGNVDRIEEIICGDTMQIYYNEYSLRYLFMSEGFDFLGAQTLEAYGKKTMIAYKFKKVSQSTLQPQLLKQAKCYMRDRLDRAFSRFENETRDCLESIDKNNVVLYGDISLIMELNKIHSFQNINGIIMSDIDVPVKLTIEGLNAFDFNHMRVLLAGGESLKIVVASFTEANKLAVKIVTELPYGKYEIYVPSRFSAMKSIWFNFASDRRMSKTFKLIKFDKPAMTRVEDPALLFLKEILDRVNKLADKWISKSIDVAICGAGRHTAFLLKYTRLSNCRIVNVFDDNANGSLCRNTILPFEKIDESSATVFLISSTTFQDAIAMKVNKFAGKRSVVKIYDNNEVEMASQIIYRLGTK